MVKVTQTIVGGEQKLPVAGNLDPNDGGQRVVVHDPEVAKSLSEVVEKINELRHKTEQEEYWPRFLSSDGVTSTDVKASLFNLERHDIVTLIFKTDIRFQKDRIFGEFLEITQREGKYYINVTSLYPESNPRIELCLNDQGLKTVWLVAKRKSFAHDFILMLIYKIHGTLSFIDQDDR